MDTNTWVIGCHNESAEGKRRKDIDFITFKEIFILTPTQLMDKVEKAGHRQNSKQGRARRSKDTAEIVNESKTKKKTFAEPSRFSMVVST
jgi:hypothetical protein